MKPHNLVGTAAIRFEAAVKHMENNLKIQPTDKQLDVLEEICAQLESLRAGEGKTTIIETLWKTDM